jgi:hypothetical protein
MAIMPSLIMKLAVSVPSPQSSPGGESVARGAKPNKRTPARASRLKSASYHARPRQLNLLLAQQHDLDIHHIGAGRTGLKMVLRIGYRIERTEESI